MYHVYTHIVHVTVCVNSNIYVQFLLNRSVFIWFETTALRVAKVNNNRPSASLVTKVFECFYIEQMPDAETSRSARWFPGETCFVPIYRKVFNQQMMLAGTTFSRFLEVNGIFYFPELVPGSKCGFTSHFLCM